MGNTVSFNTFHLNSTKASRIKGYSFGSSKSFISNINSQVLKFIFYISKRQKTKKSFLINEIQFYSWKILNYYKKWYLIIGIRDNFIYNASVKKNKKSLILNNWLNRGSFRYFKFIRNFWFTPVERLKEIFGFRENLSKSLNNFLFYLNYLFFRLPFILKIKKKLYNFILYNFFSYKFFNIFNPKIYFSVSLEIIPSAFFVSLFISKKLIHRFSLGAVLWKSIIYLRHYFNRNLISGFKILIVGRVSRRDRAAYQWRRFGKQSLNTKFSAIDFYVRRLTMRYGVCSIKIWIQK